MLTSAHTSKKWLSQKEQEALLAASTLLIDSLFDEYVEVDVWKPDTILSTRLGKHLPKTYFSNYTPFFFKQFGMCVVSMAWKLAQPKLALPASLAEQIAAWAILEEAKELLKQEREPGSEEEMTHIYQAFIKKYFPDTGFLLLFDPDHDGRDVNASALVPRQTSFAFENWLSPFHERTQSVHPYAGGSEQVGRAYTQSLTRRERRTLAAAIEVLIDEIFDDITLAERNGSEEFSLTTLSWHLPMQYSSHYTPLFLKKFVVCILTAAWKLAQLGRIVLSSLAEEMAAWAIMTTAKRQIEIDYEAEEKEGGERAAEYAFESLIEVFFEDEDFLLLFERQYSGIHAGPVGQMLHMTSLAFVDWMKPFTDEQERIAHPYVFRR